MEQRRHQQRHVERLGHRPPQQALDAALQAGVGDGWEQEQHAGPNPLPQEHGALASVIAKHPLQGQAGQGNVAQASNHEEHGEQRVQHGGEANAARGKHVSKGRGEGVCGHGQAEPTAHAQVDGWQEEGRGHDHSAQDQSPEGEGLDEQNVDQVEQDGQQGEPKEPELQALHHRVVQQAALRGGLQGVGGDGRGEEGGGQNAPQLLKDDVIVGPVGKEKSRMFGNSTRNFGRHWVLRIVSAKNVLLMGSGRAPPAPSEEDVGESVGHDESQNARNEQQQPQEAVGD